MQSLFSQTSPFIVVDQFGYRTTAKKVAIIRDPQIGYDANESFVPSNQYGLIEVKTGQIIFNASPLEFNSGSVDASSGDVVWWFDFSHITTPGEYFVKDLINGAKSETFVISDTVYKHVLKVALKAFYYNRAGIDKLEKHAGKGYSDAASHVGDGQDKEAILYNNTLSTKKDLSGGWYDAGDFNQYTAWTADYVISLLEAYRENPSVWTDDFNIPESGNGVPDILDEAKWGMDWLLKMSQLDGSSLSVLERDHASPPSAAQGPSLYGPATTFATLKSAKAFALGAIVYKMFNASQFSSYSNLLQSKSIKAWDWALINPNEQFDNAVNKVAAGNQETNDLGRLTAKIGAATYLFELTGSLDFKTYVESTYKQMPLIAWSNYASQYFVEQQELLMRYSNLSGISTTVKNEIIKASNTAFTKSVDFFGAFQKDPYQAFIKDYNWGSNAYKSKYGNMYRMFSSLNFNQVENEKYNQNAESYLHYIHGVNPLGLCYLTNMKKWGAEKSVSEMYHSWFSNGSGAWDKVGVSTYGPASGFLVGGANDQYDFDACCNSSCGSSENTALCFSMNLMPPKQQPAQKSYKDFNDGWPLNSWQISEPSLGYQVEYIKLLSKYTVNSNVVSSLNNDDQLYELIHLYPNPTIDKIYLESNISLVNDFIVKVYDIQGVNVLIEKNDSGVLDVKSFKQGVYFIEITQNQKIFRGKFIKN